MSETTTLLTAFGFTAKDAKIIADQALGHDLTPADVQAWIEEAQTSTTLHNPLGFVRARLRDGDKLPAIDVADCHQIQRHRYLDWGRGIHANRPGTSPHPIQACACGHVVWKSSLCHTCGLCPSCCKCPLAEIDKE